MTRAFETRHSEPVEEEPGFVSLETYLVDSATGERVAHADIYAAFARLEATGLCVKSRWGAADFPDSLPGFGRIVEITDDYVILNGTHEIPRARFHDWYQLD